MPDREGVGGLHGVTLEDEAEIESSGPQTKVAVPARIVRSEVGVSSRGLTYRSAASFTTQLAFRGASEKMRLTERFPRTAENTLLYEFTVDDPTSFTKPFTGQLPMTKTNEPLYEYACHEGNYGVANVLAGARAEEKKK